MPFIQNGSHATTSIGTYNDVAGDQRTMNIGNIAGVALLQSYATIL